jgi:hypothetical protein
MIGNPDKAAHRPGPGVLNQPVGTLRRRPLLIAGAVFLLAVGAVALWRYYGSHPPAWLSRWRVQRFLKSESHTGNFKVADFAFPSQADMAKKPSPEARPAASGKPGEGANDFESLCDEYFTLKTSALILERGLERAQAELKESTAALDALTPQIADAQATNISQLESNATELRARIVELRKNATSRGELNAKELALVPIVEALWKHQHGFMAEVEAEASSLRLVCEVAEPVCGRPPAAVQKRAELLRHVQTGRPRIVGRQPTARQRQPGLRPGRAHTGLERQQTRLERGPE